MKFLTKKEIFSLKENDIVHLFSDAGVGYGFQPDMFESKIKQIKFENNGVVINCGSIIPEIKFLGGEVYKKSEIVNQLAISDIDDAGIGHTRVAFFDVKVVLQKVN